MGFRAPDALLLPAGNGTLLIGSHIGFRELKENGLVDRIPRHIAVQAENCAPLLTMFRDNLDSVPAIEAGETIAEGVAIAAPVRGKEIVGIVRETGGEVLAVSDAEVESALVLLGRKGLYVEPTAALSVAAFLKFPGVRSGTVVAPLTGHGLKATEKMQKIASKQQVPTE